MVWFKEYLVRYQESIFQDDVVALINSRGQSKNILDAAKIYQELVLSIITLTGFSINNPLKKLGCINLCVDSYAYNIVEMTHRIWLLAVVDSIIFSAKYPLKRILIIF